MKLSIVIPVYNEEETIKYTLFNLRERLNIDYEIIVVDDYSSDKTYGLVEEISQDFPNLKLITNQYNKGFANALRTGLRAAQNEVVIPVMADLCDEIEIIPQMYNKVVEGYDIVCGSRYIRGGQRKCSPFLKTIVSRYFNKLLHLITRIPNTDLTNPFKAYRKDVLDKINTKSTSFEISLEIVLKAYFAGYKITELPTIWQERVLGRSHFSIFRNGIKFLRWLLPNKIFKLFIIMRKL